MESETQIEKGVLNESIEEKEKIQEANRNESVKKVEVALQMLNRATRTRIMFIIIFFLVLIGFTLTLASQDFLSKATFVLAIIVTIWHLKHENDFIDTLKNKYGI